MRVLAKWEQEEFEKTFNFISVYIGTSYWLDAKMYTILDLMVKKQMMKF